MTYRGYKIEGDGTFGYFHIKPSGGKGNVPQTLRGMFTKPKEAERAIDRQLNSKLSKNKPAKVAVES
jgi:hypothetical protein